METVKKAHLLVVKTRFKPRFYLKHILELNHIIYRHANYRRAVCGYNTSTIRLKINILIGCLNVTFSSTENMQLSSNNSVDSKEE